MRRLGNITEQNKNEDRADVVAESGAELPHNAADHLVKHLHYHLCNILESTRMYAY